MQLQIQMQVQMQTIFHNLLVDYMFVETHSFTCAPGLFQSPNGLRSWRSYPKFLAPSIDRFVSLDIQALPLPLPLPLLAELVKPKSSSTHGFCVNSLRVETPQAVHCICGMCLHSAVWSIHRDCISSFAFCLCLTSLW